jgi:hypothetical protein
MGFSLANAGLMYQGAAEVLDQDQRRRDAVVDRQYTLEERDRKRREAERAEAERLRQESYSAEVRATMGDYLAGGAKAKPAQEAEAAQPLDPYEVDQGAIGRAGKAAKPAQDNTEGMYEALRSIAAKHGQQKDYEAMEKRLKAYKEEGVLDFIAKARQGAPDDELVETFNKSGKLKIKGIKRVDDDDFEAVLEDGRTTSLNVTRMTESLLTPKDQLALKDKESERERKAREAEQKVIVARERLALDERNAASRRALQEAQAELAQYRAGGGGAKPAKPRSWTSFDNEIGKAAADLSTSTDPGGKKVVDHARKAAIKSMAQALARANPEDYDSPGAAVDAAVERLDEVRNQAAARAQREVQQNPGAPAAFRESAAQYVQRRTDELTKGTLRQAAKAKPAETSAAPAAASGDVAQPKSQADFNKLPKGARYVNPADGRVYVKN